jgi:hypothetical protein
MDNRYGDIGGDEVKDVEIVEKRQWHFLNSEP